MMRFSERGDTIVEVLLALVIVSTVLGGAFISSNSSLTNSRQAQERGEALKYVETQLERIKASPPADALFCFDSGGTKTTSFSSTPPTDQNSDDYSTYPAGCAQGTGNRYHLFTTQAAGTYTSYAHWDSADGKTKDQIRIIYRASP